MTDPRPPFIPDDGHAGDLVSARLDGELDPQTSAWVDAHLEGCDGCRDLAGAVDAARSWMRSSPTVDSSPVVESVIARRRRLVGTGLAFVGVVLLVLGLLAVTAAVSHPRVVPDIEALVAAHETSGHGELDGMRLVDRAGSRYATPVTVGGVETPMERRSIFDGDDLTTVVYDASEGVVTVYEQPGRLDWAALPVGTTEPVAGRAAWSRNGAPAVVVTEIGDLVVTVVADDLSAVRAVVATLPAPHRSSTIDRMHDSCQELMEIFALGG